MSDTPRPPNGQESRSAFLMRLVAFGVGITVFLYEVFIGHDRIIAGMAAAFCGPIVAQNMALIISAIRGGNAG